MDKIVVHAKLVAMPGRGDEVAKLLRELIEGQTAGEPGTELFVVSRNEDDPDTFRVFEVYTDADARAAHHSSAEFLRISPQIRALLADADLFAGTPEVATGLER